MIIIPPPFNPSQQKWGYGPTLSKPQIGAFSSENYLCGYLRGVLRFKSGQTAVSVAANNGPWTFDLNVYNGVVNVQTFWGLYVDGLVGPQTWGVIDYLATH